MNAANLMCRLKHNATGFSKIRTCVKAELSKGPIQVKPLLAQAFIKHKDLCQKISHDTQHISLEKKIPRHFKKWNSHHKMSLP
jgi:hypothetical protein